MNELQVSMPELQYLDCGTEYSTGLRRMLPAHGRRIDLVPGYHSLRHALLPDVEIG